jgi:diphthine synthase
MTKLIFIGLGLHDCGDLSMKAMDVLKTSNFIFAEFYTASMAKEHIASLEAQVGKTIEVLNREQVEQGDILIDHAKQDEVTVAFLVPGDPMTATTHVDLLLRAKKENVTTSILHAPSITTVVPGLLGLQFYKFGRTTTLAYPEGDYFPESPFEVLMENQKLGLHTLILLDIHADEKRYMTANEGIELLLSLASRRGQNIYTSQTLTCVVARAGSDDQVVAADAAEQLLHRDFGAPMHSLVVPGKLHFKESEALIVLAGAPERLLK